MIVHTGYFDTYIPYYVFKVIIHKQQFYRILGTSLSTCIYVLLFRSNVLCVSPFPFQLTCYVRRRVKAGFNKSRQQNDNNSFEVVLHIPVNLRCNYA